MEIREFTHARRADQNRALFGLIGEYCASSAIRDKLGCSISSRPGQIWLVAVRGRTVLAFGSILRRANKTAALRHLFSPADDHEAWKAVLDACVERAGREGCRSVALVDYANLADTYAAHGFLPAGIPRGRFEQFVRVLEASHDD